MRYITSVLVLVLGAVSIASAQARPAQRPLELDRLRFLTGTFSGEVQLFPGDSAPPTVGRVVHRGVGAG